MDSPTDSSIDDLAARANVKSFGDISIITIPDVETLSESEKIVVLKKAERRLLFRPLDAEALRSRLQSITPPPDDEEDDEESRLLEAQARKDLKRDGCPACYPPHLDVPVRDAPEEYRPIIEYWRSLSSTGDVVLCAQRSDWRRFRTFQTRVRDRHGDKSFITYVDEVRDRRRRHGLHGDFHLLFDSQRQRQQENWIEYQNYHLKHHERLKKKREGLESALDAPQKKAVGTVTEGSDRAAQNITAIQRRLEYTERTLDWHEILLGWVEEQRLTMDLRPLTPVEEDSGDRNALRNAVRNAVRNASTRQRRSCGLDVSTVIGKVRVSKPKSRNRPSQTLNALKTQPLIVDSGVTTLSSSQQLPKRRGTTPRCAADTPLGPIRPQRVCKARRSTDTGTKSRPGTQCRDDRAWSQRRSAPRRPHPTLVKARSGGIRGSPASRAPQWKTASVSDVCGTPK